MKIDKDKLVELLVDKTSMEKEEVQAQLDQLIDRIVDAASRGKALEIKDFGLFYFDESQELKFEAAKELSTEISFKYAGMRPVELQPERDSTIVSDFEPSESEQQEKKEDEFEEDPFTEAAADDEDDPFEDLFEEDEPAHKKEKDEPDDIFADDDDDLDDFDFLSDLPDEQDEPKSEEETDEEKAKLAASKTKLNRQPVRKKNNAGIWVVAAILLIAVLAGAFYYFTEMQQVGQQATPPPQTAQPDPAPETVPEELPVISDEQLAVEVPEAETPEIEPEQELPAEVPTQAEPLETVAPEDQPLYGLTGIVNEAADNGYSIVLHSFNDEVNARQTAEMLGNDGYRVLVSSRNVANNTMWRVSVGQFETLTDAQEAISRLPSPYNTQNFIHRIQIN